MRIGHGRCLCLRATLTETIMEATIQERVKRYHAEPDYAAKANAMYADLLARSAVDEDFRQQLLKDPRAALAAFSGNDSASSANIVFLENNADATIVLPDRVSRNAELSESDLEAVAGGTYYGWITDVVITAVVLYDAAANYVKSQVPQVQ
jgi:predicted PP-loop superfamily ATPase